MSNPSEEQSLTNKAHPILERAARHDLDAVVALYRAAAEMPECTWNDQYPSRETAEEDLAAGGLYVLRMNGSVIGAASLVSENELDDLTCFAIRDGAREFARITVSPECRGNGYAGYMLNMLTETIRRTGATAWHILVAVGNHAAIALYRSFGFAFLGECEMYGHTYHICEKAL